MRSKDSKWLKFWFVVLVLTLISLPQTANPIDLGVILQKGAEILIPAAILLDDKTAEKLVGELGSAQIESEKGIYQNLQLETRLNRIRLQLVGSDETKANWTFKILNDYNINAYAVPGGHIYFTRALMEIPDITDAELAAVMGHEMVHIEKRHGLKQLKNVLAIDAGTRLFKLDSKEKVWTLLAGQLYTSGRSRDNERESDLVGMEKSAAAGYDPQGALMFMRRLETMREIESRRNANSPLITLLEQRLRTHPPTSERCEYLKDRLFETQLGSNYRLAGATMVSPTTQSTQKWYPGTIHLHTTFSDGNFSIDLRAKEAQINGCSFLIPTDHGEQINQQEKAGAHPITLRKDVGLDNYLKQCQQASEKHRIFVIPGAEIESRWMPEANATQEARAHTLVWPIDSDMSGYLENLQQNVLHRANQGGLVTVAAHPNLIAKHSVPTDWWQYPQEIWNQIYQWGDFRYDLRPADEQSYAKPIGRINYDNLKGIEFFNVEKAEENEGVIDIYRRLIREGRYLFVTAGNDSHGWEPISDKTIERNQRKTWVSCDGTRDGILNGIRAGRTCATALGFGIRTTNFIPGSEYQPVAYPEFKLTLTRLLSVPPPSLRIYQIDKLVANVTPKIAGDEVTYYWTDPKTKSGNHRYVLYVPNCFISSPISVSAGAESRDKILIEAGPHHLGDDRADSQTLWWKEFQLNAADLANRTSATFKFRVKGAPRKDPVVSFNRHEIGAAITHTDKWEWFEFPVPLSALRPGKNLIDVETIIANLANTFDDCEFADCYLLFH